MFLTDSAQQMTYCGCSDCVWIILLRGFSNAHGESAYPVMNLARIGPAITENRIYGSWCENSAVVSVLAYALATMTQRLPRKPLPLPDWLK